MAKESERHIYVCRGAVKMATVPKTMMTGRAQFEIIHALDFVESEYGPAMDRLLAKKKAATATTASS